MGKLDFSGINRIACECFKEYPEEQDSLLQAGFTIVNVPTPFDTPQEEPQKAHAAPPPSASAESSSAQEKRSEGAKKPFTDHTGDRDYNRLYRIAHDFHQRHNPPTVDREYWRIRIPEVDDAPEVELRYWNEAAKDMAETISAEKGDPFLQALLSSVWDELERDYKALRNSI